MIADVQQELKEDSSFSEEKEAKRLCSFDRWPRVAAQSHTKEQKFFASFFQKRRFFLLSPKALDFPP
ncbi:MAG TPA: hypothetical protein VMB71_04985 [Acetobacteraceae bacterium]|nr:hypothetical protein [Acetobacteraceae bacterium]